MHYILGIDSGGTKTEAVLVRPNGEVVGWGRWAAPEAGAGEDGGRSLPAVQDAVRRAIGDTAIYSLQIVNTGNGLPLRRLLPAMPAGPVTIKNVVESDSIFCLAPLGPAVVALAGTGSHIAGRDGCGRQVVLDGLGPYIGDYGGAVTIGLEGMRAAAKNDWHPRHRTSLAAALTRALQEIEPPRRRHNLVAFMYMKPDRWKVAALARYVDAEAEAGDATAQAIIRQAGRNYAEVAFDVLERLALRQATLPLIAFGSVATNSRLFWQSFRAAVAEFAPGVQMARLGLPPAACHALSALHGTGPGDFAAARCRLRETLGPFLGRDIPRDLDDA